MRYIDDSGNVNHICETCRYNFRGEYSYPCRVCVRVGANNTDMWSLDEDCTEADPFKTDTGNAYLTLIMCWRELQDFEGSPLKKS